MEAQAEVNVGWALWGKPPGSNSDYSVLAASAEPLSEAEFGSVLAHFAPGTPPTEDNLPSSLPWVIISRVGIEDRPYIGMAIQRSSKEVDSVGRPITMTSYFCLPYAELAGLPVSYAGLYRELAAVQLPHSEGGLIRLSVPRLDAAVIAAKVTERNWEPSAAAAAALLLDGPVSIVGAEGSTMEERLHYLDAVAALLPFGYRSDLTASTWSDIGARHQIRLAFAARGRDETGVVQWRSAEGGASRGKPGSPGGSYLRLLHDVRAHRTGPTQLTALVDTLARAGAESGFGDPNGAINTLREFDFPFIVLAAVLDGTAEPADIRAVFERNRVPEVDSAGRQSLFSALIGLGDVQDLPTIRAWWDTIAGGETEAVRPALVSVCRRLLWSPAPGLAVKDYLALAAEHGMLDPVLADLVALPDTSAELRGGMSAAAQLIADWALSTLPPDLPLTRQALTGTPLVVAELLSQLAGSDWGPRAALDWLGPEMGEFLRAFAVVLGESGGLVDRPQLDQLAYYGVGCVGALLQAAAHSGRLNLMLPAFSGWLAIRELSAADRDEAQYWCDLTWALLVSDPANQAWIDLALLASDNDPRFLLQTVYGATAEPYCESLTAAWSELAAGTGRAADDLLAGRLTEYLDRVPWLADELKVDTVILITQLLTHGGCRAQLASAVANALLNNPEAARSAAARQWLSQVRPDFNDPRSGSVLMLLRRPQPRLTEQDLVGLCARGCSEGTDPEELCRALADSGAVRSGSAALRLLDQLRARLYKVQVGQLDPYTWLKTFATCIAGGGLGEEIAEGLRKMVVQAAYEDFVYRLDILYIATTRGRPDSQPDLSSDEIKYLEWAPRSLDYILKEARKRPGRSILRGGKRDRDEDDDQAGHATQDNHNAR